MTLPIAPHAPKDWFEVYRFFNLQLPLLDLTKLTSDR